MRADMGRGVPTLYSVTVFRIAVSSPLSLSALSAMELNRLGSEGKTRTGALCGWGCHL